MADAFVQYEGQFVDTGTSPLVSMFKLDKDEKDVSLFS